MSTFSFRNGSKINRHGKRWTVTSIGPRVRLQNARGRVKEDRLVDILNDSEFVGVETAPREAPWRSPLEFDLLPPEQARKAAEQVDFWRPHINEVLTGYQSGSADARLPGEPREKYDPVRPLGQRIHAKAKEVKKSTRTVERRIEGIQNEGDYGLVDARLLKPQQWFKSVDARIKDALRTQIDLASQPGQSRKTGSYLLSEAVAALETEFPEIEWRKKMPSRATCYRLLEALGAGPAIGLSNKTKSSHANRPRGRYDYTRRASRPGERVQMDATILDVMCIDRLTGRRFRPEMVAAIDEYTGCILGFLLRETTRQEDVAAVIAQTLRPQPIRPEWGELAEWPYHGVPGTLQLPFKATKPKAPTILPEKIVIDNGAPFASHHITYICAKLGIGLEPTRPYRGVEKPKMERFWGTLNTGLLQFLPAHTSGSVDGRGLDVDQDAVLFTDEAADIIGEWIARVYHLRPHRGLRLPGSMKSGASPYEMYCAGIERAGMIVAHTDPKLWLRILPSAGRTIGAKGVSLRGLVYDAPILAEYEGVSGPEHGGKWRFHYEPGDARQIYFEAPDGAWHEIPWVLRTQDDQPFSFEAADWTRRKLNEDGWVRDFDKELRSILHRWRTQLPEDGRARTLATRMDMFMRALTEDPNRPSPGAVINYLADPQTDTDVVEVPEKEVDLSDDPIEPDLDGTDFDLESEPDPDTYYAGILDDLDDGDYDDIPTRHLIRSNA
ncbi:transposase [Curtobacterium citreum]|uniref:DDE-type integrase/transposase/recombinase n=1 Tax=Curtobacterium citreum TaxID=2036 RepID=A0ABT2HKN9_9MICO|nr:DDE-type integrase/transposase/recombinase [Curtobacterium citreum]MCS6523836.1 DDE-type integrase/transposase/recombinase [Curtobacterium citreum]TQJ26371.1 integrase-like protein [Curtobacterium citreum]GGL86663.1 transposase [Curtobacterium citreum]